MPLLDEALLTSLLQDHSLGPQSIRALAQGPGNGPCHKYHAHTRMAIPKQSRALCLHPDRKIVATDEGREPCFLCCFAHHKFPSQSLAMSLGEWGELLTNKLATNC